MNVDDLKFGAKITLNGNREFRLMDIRKEAGKDYIVCITNKKPILPIIFEYKVDGDTIRVRAEKDTEILKSIYAKMVEENS